MDQRIPGIILAAFGTARPRCLSVLEGFAARARARFPGVPLAWAFSAHFLGREGSKRWPSLESACRDLTAYGVQALVVQPLHCIPGAEHASLKNRLNHLKSVVPGPVVLGSPLLRNEDDAQDLALLMHGLTPPDDPEEIRLWVGHGSSHTGSQGYRQLAAAMEAVSPRLLLAELRPAESFDHTLERLRRKHCKRVMLLPFFSLTGLHANRDLGGNCPESWKMRLERHGVHVRFIPKGMLEYPEFSSLWLNRLSEALKGLFS